jgi:nucleotidyltransferase/DNA polymerase involved in DNA repair
VSTMPRKEEKRRRVFAHVRLSVPANGDEGRWVQAREICSDYSSHVRQAEGGLTLDLTGTERLLGEPKAVARELRNRLRAAVGLNAAVGLGPSAAVARLASRVAATGQVLEIGASEAPRFLGRLPVEQLPGVDGEWARWLGEMGIRLASDLAALSEETVTRTLGARGVAAWRAARGEDPEEGEEPVAASAAADSVAGAVDFFPAARERAEMRAALREAAGEVARQLRQQGKAARQVGLELVLRDLRRVEVRRTLVRPASSPRAIYATASLLLDRTRLGSLQVRRLRVRAARLVLDARGGQMALPMVEGSASPTARVLHRSAQRDGRG